MIKPLIILTLIKMRKEKGLKLRGKTLAIESGRPGRRYQSLHLIIPGVKQQVIANIPTSLLSLENEKKLPEMPSNQKMNSYRDKNPLSSFETANGFIALSERNSAFIPSNKTAAIKKCYPALSIRLPQIGDNRVEQKINMQTEDEFYKGSKCYVERPLNETITILYNIQELCKLFKFRLDDIASLERHVNFQLSTLKSGLQFVDKIILDVETRETARIALEIRKIKLMEGLRTDDRDTRKTIAKNIKKTLSEFERKSFFKVPERVMSIADHLREIVLGEPPAPEPKVKISHNKLLAIALRYAFRETKNDPEFISQVCILYTRLILKKALKSVIDMYNKEAISCLRRRWIRQISTTTLWKSIERTKQECNELCKAKIINSLKKSNKTAYKTIKKCREEYIKHDINKTITD